jgi:hypothetical protein
VFEAGLFGGVLGMRRTFFSMQAGRSFRPTSWASRAYGMPTR